MFTGNQTETAVTIHSSMNLISFQNIVIIIIHDLIDDDRYRQMKKKPISRYENEKKGHQNKKKFR